MARIASNAHQALDSLAADEFGVPAQALAEFFTVLTRKARWPAGEARAAVLTWDDASLVADTSSAVLMEAMDLTVMYQYSLWDAVMLTSAAQSGFRVLLSADAERISLARCRDQKPVPGT